MVHPSIWYLNDQTMRATVSKTVFVHLCGGSERYTSCAELEFAPLKVFLKISRDHDTDTCVIVRMRRKSKTRSISGLEKRESRNSLNPGDPAMVTGT